MSAQAMLHKSTDSAISISVELYERLMNGAHHLLIRGVSPVDVDNLLTDFGFEMGPFEAQDLTGLEKDYLKRLISGVDRKSSEYLHSGMMISDRMVQEGRLGKIAGVGWYRYPGGKGKVEDPLLEDLIREEAYFANILQEQYSDDEILSFLIDKLKDAIVEICRENADVSVEDIIDICVDRLRYPRSKAGILQGGNSTINLN